jgi:radical SAM-linked protein
MSQGYNPRPRLSFPLALEVGVSGEDEVLDLQLTEWIHPEELETRLGRALPEGVGIRRIRSVAGTERCQARLIGYRVRLHAGHRVEPATVESLLERDSLSVERKRKGRVVRKDIRRFIRGLRLSGDDLEMLFEMTESGTARPEEVLAALGCRHGRDYRISEIVRTRVSLVSPN